MRSTITILVACLIGACGLLAKSVATQSKQTTVKARTASRVSSAKTIAARKSRAAYRKPVRRQPVSPSGPGSSRIREVQQALVERGYLQSEATGSWNVASADALKRFESDQKVRVDGKIDAKTLIALGLGPKYDSNLNLPVTSASGTVVAADQSTNNEPQRD